MSELGTVITAIVTPFDERLRVDEEAFVVAACTTSPPTAPTASSCAAPPARPRR